MRPHIILVMHTLKSLKGVQSMYLIEGNEDGEPYIFNSFEDAKKYQDDKAIDGRVVEIPIYDL